MRRARQHVYAPLLAAVLTSLPLFSLAGCGAAPQLARPLPRPAAQAPVQPRQAAPVAPAAPGVPPASVPSRIEVVSEAAMTEDELAAAGGYSLFKTDEAGKEEFKRKGVVRRTTDGFFLETSSGLSSKDKGYTLVATGDLASALAAVEGQRVEVVGTLPKGETVVTVTAISGVSRFDFGKLRDRLIGLIKNGKISGHVKDAYGNSIKAVSIELKRSTDGVIIRQESDTNGNFTLKSVAPGDYILTVKSQYSFYQPVMAAITVKTRRTIQVKVTLQTASPSPAPSVAPSPVASPAD